jgi:uncharacterized membrane protein YjjP (DUF1212 family)
MSDRSQALGRMLIGAVSVAGILLLPSVSSACEVCYGAADSSVIDATRTTILFMFAVTGAVLASFAAFFIRLIRLSMIHGRRGG